MRKSLGRAQSEVVVIGLGVCKSSKFLLRIRSGLAIFKARVEMEAWVVSGNS